jgi:hypothetical protein
MTRIPVFLTIIISFIMLNVTAGADELTAIDIFDGMIYYESDQLTTTPSIRDYKCMIIATSVRAGGRTQEIVEKSLYFMVPAFQLQLFEDKPVFYFDHDLLIVLLESHELTRQRDEVIEDAPCYAIRLTPLDPAFAHYYKTYYVAQDDFRHIRTIVKESDYRYDNLTTEINYTYETVGIFNLLSQTVAEINDENDNLLATVTTDYTDYEFGIGLSIDFFTNYLEGTNPTIPH